MKWKFSKVGLLVILIIIGLAIPINAAQTVQVINDGSQLTVKVNGTQVNFDQPPTIFDGHTMVPFRVISEALGATVEWNSTSNKVTICGNKKVELTIGSTKAMVNGNEVVLDTPAAIIGGRTMVPLRFVGEALGAEVIYIPSVQTGQPTISKGLLPNEEKIQKSLTPEDINRLQSYPNTYIQGSTGNIETFHGKFGDLGNRFAPIDSYLKIVYKLNDLSSVDYTMLKNAAYIQEYKRNCYSVLGESELTKCNIETYISDAIANKLKIKAYFLVSKDTICEYTGGLVSVRIKYIFYQDSGSKIEEKGSTLRKWYWQDIQYNLNTCANHAGVYDSSLRTPDWYRSNVDVIQLFGNVKKLNNPQPYNF
ncbi:MAG: copper amine oxidase N-terminal domain-containing protein [Deltaproteobacteria bacterium]